MALPVLQTVVGIGLESPTAYGVPVPAADWIPVSGAPKPSDKVKMDPDAGWRGSMGTDYGLVAGIYNTDYSYDSYVFVDTFGWALAGILGDVTTTGGTPTGTPTTTTGALVAGTTSVVPVTSATGITTGCALALDTAAATELVSVASVAGTNVTLTHPVTINHATGAAVQVVTGPFTTAFALYNGTTGQPPSYTVTDWYAVNGRQYPGCVFSGCSLKISGDGLLSYSATLSGLPSVSLAGAKPQASYTSVRPLSGWQGIASIGGVTVETVLSCDLDLKRKTTPINPITGQQAPTSIFAADLAVTGKLSVIMQDDSALTDYITNVQPPLDLNYQVGTGAGATGLRLHLNQAGYTMATIERGKEYVQNDITFTALFNPNDAGPSGGFSPIKATLTNAVGPRTYK